MKNKTLLLISSLLLSFLLLSCQAQTQTPTGLIETKLPMGYIPDIQQAPVYVADHNRAFDATGYHFSFDYSYETDGVALVAAGEVPFAFASGDQVLLAREQGLDVVYVMAWYQQYPVSILALADANIQSPQDLIGKRVGIPGAYGANYIALRALLSAQNIPENQVILESIGYNQAEALVTDTVDAASVYINNTPVQLQSQGYQIIQFPVADYLNLASNGLVTSQQMIDQNPQAVAAMVTALTQALTETIADPDNAYQISTQYVQTLSSSDSEIQKEVLAQSIELWKSDPIGYIQAQSWQNMQQTLLEMNLLTDQVDLSAAYTNQFIPTEEAK